MNDTTYSELFELLAWQHRDTTYRVLFRDGDDYDLKGVVAGKDIDQPAHADGLVIRCRRGGVSSGALFFWLDDVVRVQDGATSAVLWSAA